MQIRGIRVYKYPPDGPCLKCGQDAVDLICAAKAENAAWIAVPMEKFDASFFQLRSGLAGEFLQKFVTYGINLAVLGNFSSIIAKSTPFRDLIRESNRGSSLWFLNDFAEMQRVLSPLSGPLVTVEPPKCPSRANKTLSLQIP